MSLIPRRKTVEIPPGCERTRGEAYLMGWNDAVAQMPCTDLAADERTEQFERGYQAALREAAEAVKVEAIRRYDEQHIGWTMAHDREHVERVVSRDIAWALAVLEAMRRD